MLYLATIVMKDAHYISYTCIGNNQYFFLCRFTNSNTQNLLYDILCYMKYNNSNTTGIITTNNNNMMHNIARILFNANSHISNVDRH